MPDVLHMCARSQREGSAGCMMCSGICCYYIIYRFLKGHYFIITHVLDSWKNSLRMNWRRSIVSYWTC